MHQPNRTFTAGRGNRQVVLSSTVPYLFIPVHGLSQILVSGGTLAGLSLAIRPPKNGDGSGRGPTLPQSVEAIGSMTGLRQLNLSYEEMLAPSLAGVNPGVAREAGKGWALDTDQPLGALAPLSSLAFLESFRQAIP